MAEAKAEKLTVRGRVLAIPLAAAIALSACAAPPIQHGFVMPPNALEQIPDGSSQEQVLLVLGTPSTTSTVGGQAYYYISQTSVDTRIWGTEITDQRVLAIYFDENNQVREKAHYGMKDGKVFDFISRRTRTGGADVNLVGQMLGAVGRGAI